MPSVSSDSHLCGEDPCHLWYATDAANECLALFDASDLDGSLSLWLAELPSGASKLHGRFGMRVQAEMFASDFGKEREVLGLGHGKNMFEGLACRFVE